MSDKEQKWDDIPSLKLEMDDDYDSRMDSKEGRGCARVDSGALKSIISAQGVTRFPIRIATAKKGVFDGVIEDLSETGVRLIAPKVLAKNEMTKVGFKMDDRTIISKAIVRWVSPREEGCTAGLEFQAISAADQEFIRTLTTASLFNKTGAFRV